MPDINIMRIDPVSRRVTWGFNIMPAKNSHIESLVQLAAKTILSTPGQDYLRKEYGGGILSLSGRSLNKADIALVNADIAYIVKTSEEQIIREQIGQYINAHERLRRLTLLGINADFTQGVININVSVENESGESSSFNFDASLKS